MLLVESALILNGFPEAIGDILQLFLERSSGNLVAEFERSTLSFLEATHRQGIAQLLRHTLQHLLNFGLGRLNAIGHHRGGSFVVETVLVDRFNARMTRKFPPQSISDSTPVIEKAAKPRPTRLDRIRRRRERSATGGSQTNSHGPQLR